MSQNYDVNWLSSRTLHISGIESNERNTSILQTKLNYFLSRTNSGKVIDINFIPNYNKLIKYEIQKNEINDLKAVITKEKPFMRCYFKKKFKSFLLYISLLIKLFIFIFFSNLFFLIKKIIYF